MKDKFIVVRWPDIQQLMGEQGFDENSHLINDDLGLKKFGSSSYFVNEDWYLNTENIIKYRNIDIVVTKDYVLNVSNDKICFNDYYANVRQHQIYRHNLTGINVDDYYKKKVVSYRKINPNAPNLDLPIYTPTINKDYQSLNK